MSLSGKLNRLLVLVLGDSGAAKELVSAVNAGGGSLGASLAALDALTPAANKGVQFTGTTTAATFDLTAAAKTVLDDATVAAMVDTLGGAAATGTGGLARATSPVFVTPALGTPASGVLTNCTGTAAGLTAGAATLAAAATVLANARTINGISFNGSADINIGVPQNSKSADYTLALTDNGKHIFHPAADANDRTITIPANGTIAFPVGASVTFVNKSVNDLAIAITTDTLTWADEGSTGSRTLATNGVATALKVTTTEWLISGPGLS